MKKLLLLLVAVLAWCLPVFSQNITNVSVMQEGNKIEVSYDIDKVSSEVQLTVSTDGGKTFSAPLMKVSGDVRNVQPGRHRIVWDVLAEVDKLSGDNIVFNVAARSYHEYVDLGLSVKWATCNVGASSPEEYGNYFAWGESIPKLNYKSKAMKFHAGNGVSDKVGFLEFFAGIDSKSSNTRPRFTEDAARANWGSGWRMPTDAEWEELISKCSWKKTELNGVVGYKVTSRKRGYTDKYIFLPAAGCILNSDQLYCDGDAGYYWSSTCLPAFPDNAYYVSLSSGRASKSTRDRCNGLSVRPVRE